MGFFDPSTLGTLLTLASFDPSALCYMPQPAKINVNPRTKTVTYDTSQTLAEIQQYDIDTINPYGFNANTHTNGFMRGQINMKPHVKLNYRNVMRNQGVCLWYETINLDISIEPTIVIAKEIAADPCRYNAVKNHELKHVMVDRKIVNKYAKSMGQKIYDGLKSRGFNVGPVAPKDANEIAKRMHETVGQIIELEFRKLEIERAEQQQAVDSLEEYERVRAECSDSKTYGYHRH